MLLHAPVAFALLCFVSAQTNNQATGFTNQATGTGTSGLTAANPSQNFVFADQGIGGSSISASDLPMSKVGRCPNSNINLYTDATIATLAAERNGYWPYAAVPDTVEFNRLLWAHLHLQPSGSNYLATIYTQVQNEELQIRINLLITDTELGYAVASTTGNNNFVLNFKIFIYDYSAGRYAAFYICSDDVDDIGYDYRYVVANGWPLTNQERVNILNRDTSNQFRGSLVLL